MKIPSLERSIRFVWATLAALALCQSGVLMAQGDGPLLSIQPATLLTWPNTPVTYRVEGAPDPAGPWAPCAVECSGMVEGRQRMYMEPVGPTECFRLAVLDPGVPLYYKDFTDLSGWYTADTRITATVANDDVRLHANFGSATPLDNWGNWGGSIYPTGGYPTMPRTGTLELRADVVGANQDDAFASIFFFRYPWEPYAAYGFSKDQNEILILKMRNPHSSTRRRWRLRTRTSPCRWP